MNPRTPHYYSQRREGGNSTSIDSLPDDLLLFEILVRIPAEDIHENARIVCRRWKSIIRGDGFVNAHFCRNTCSGLVIVSKCMMEGDFANAHFRLDRSGVLIAKFSEENYHHLVAEAQSRIQISRLRYKFSFPVLAGCNGLILGKETENYRSYYVNRVTEPFIVNPATRRRFNLPHFAGGGLDGCKFALAYAVSTTEYKVVVTWCDFRLGSSAVAWCAILTVGVDRTWRRVPMEQLPDLAKLFHRTPIVTEGFIHWAQEEDVLSMNVETEAITHTRTPLPPQDHLYERRDCHYLTAGKYLSLLVSYKDNDLYEIWEMKPDSGEWRKLVDEIDLKSRIGKLRQLCCYCIVPVGWVKYPDALAFFGNGKGGSCIIYNLKNDEFNCFGASDPDSVHQLHNAVVHRNSLSSLLSHSTLLNSTVRLRRRSESSLVSDKQRTSFKRGSSFDDSCKRRLLIGGGGAMNPRTPHYYSRRRKRGNSTSIDSLSDDLLFEILVRLPAEDIHENVRIVCRRWKSIIRNDGFVSANLRHTCSGLLIEWERTDGFASAHLHRTFSGLLIAKISEEISPPTSLAAEESQTQLSRLRYKLNFPVLSGCNGLILGAESNERNRCFVVNPVTKRRFDLPGLAIGLLWSRKHFALACGVSTGEYKVVATWCEAASGSPTVARCAILTLGVDKAWRHVPIGRFHCLARWLFFQAPKVTNGFIHWAGKSEVLSMNVETEVITHTTSPLLPHDYRSMSCHCWYLSAGKYLTLLISRGDRLLIEICEMEPKTGKWRKLVNKINLRPHKRMLEATLGVHMVFVPIGWVKYPDVLAIHGIPRDAACIIYNLDTDVLAFLDTSGVYKTDVAHRNSLEWFD